ncbi:hypothetical protein Tco_1276906, partial [Tanacetum coccineum]
MKGIHRVKLLCGANLLDDPFVFGSQVDKVFYCEDPKNKGWSVVRHIKVKDVFDMGSVNASHLHRIGDDGEDVTSDMEHSNETNDANSSQMDMSTIEHSDNQNELGELDSIGPPKKVRGHTQKNELWNMNKNKIVVKFNKYGKPMGVEGNELTQFLGSVVRIAGNVRLHCEDWRKAEKGSKCFAYVGARITNTARKYSVLSYKTGVL